MANNDKVSFNTSLMALPLHADLSKLAGCNCDDGRQTWDVDDRAIAVYKKGLTPSFFFYRKSGPDTAKFVVKIFNFHSNLHVGTIGSASLLPSVFRDANGDWDCVVVPQRNVDLGVATGLYYLTVAGLRSEPFRVIEAAKKGFIDFQVGNAATLGQVPYEYGYTQKFSLEGRLCVGTPRTSIETTGDERTGKQTNFFRQYVVWEAMFHEAAPHLANLFLSLGVHDFVTVSDGNRTLNVGGGGVSVEVGDVSCCTQSVKITFEETLNQWDSCQPPIGGSLVELTGATPDYPDFADEDATADPYAPDAEGSGPPPTPEVPEVGVVVSTIVETHDCCEPWLSDNIPYQTRTEIRKADGIGGYTSAFLYSQPCALGSDQIAVPKFEFLKNIAVKALKPFGVLILNEGLFKGPNGEDPIITPKTLPAGTSYANGRLSAEVTGTTEEPGEYPVEIEVGIAGGGSVLVTGTMTVESAAPTVEDTDLEFFPTYDDATKTFKVTLNRASKPAVKITPLQGQTIEEAEIWKTAEVGTESDWVVEFPNTYPGNVLVQIKDESSTGEGIKFEYPILAKPVNGGVGLPDVTKVNPNTPQEIKTGGYTMDNFPLATAEEYALTRDVLVVVRTPGGAEIIKKANESFFQFGAKPVPPIIADKTAIVGQPFKFIWPVFTGAVSYQVTSLIPGITVANPDPTVREISGISTEINDGKEIIITGIGPTGLQTSVSFTLRSILPESRYVQTIYFKPTGTGGVRLYLFGEGGEPGIKLKTIDEDGTPVETVIDSVWTKDPGKWAAPDLFEGFAPYTYLIPAIEDDTYKVEAQLSDSSQIISVDMVLDSVTEEGLKGKKIYPATVNAYLLKSTVATGGISPGSINDGDIETPGIWAQGPIPSTEGFLVKSPSDPRQLECQFIRIRPDETTNDDRQTLAGAYIITGSNITKDFAPTDNINKAGVKWERLPNPIPTGELFDIPWSGTHEKIVIQGMNGTTLKGVEVEVYGTYAVNPPPEIVTAFQPLNLTEGDSGKLVLRTYFRDTDPLTYGGLLNGGVSFPSWLEVNPTLGELDWSNVPFAGLENEETTYYPANIMVTDTANNQKIVPLPIYVKRRNAIPDAVKFVGFRVDVGNMSGTPQLDVTGGSWAFDLIGLDPGSTYSQKNHSSATGSYRTENLTPQRSYNRSGQPFLGLTKGKTYGLDVFQPGSVPLIKFRVPVTIPNPQATNIGFNLFDRGTPTSETIQSIGVDAVRLDREHKGYPQSKATGPVLLRVEKVGGGYDTGFQTPTSAPTAGKDFYERIDNTVLADGQYKATAQLVSNPEKTLSTVFEVKTQVQRMTLYPATVNSSGQTLSLGIAFKVSPANKIVEVLKPVPSVPGNTETLPIGGGGSYSGSDDTHRTTYGSGTYATYVFNDPHVYKFRIQGQAEWIETDSYAATTGQGVRSDVWPRSGIVTGDEPISSSTRTWILKETYLDA